MICVNHTIIPDFVFRYIRKSDKQIIADLSLSPIAYYHDKSFKEYFLCFDCEKKIEIFEHYVRDFLFDLEHTGIVKIETKSKIYYKNIKCQEFQKYLLSVLWRASISNNRMFSKVKLTKEDEDKIRSILLNQNICDPHFYGCEVIKFYDEILENRNIDIDYYGILLQPCLDKFKNILFVYAGHIWKYHLEHNCKCKIEDFLSGKNKNISLNIPDKMVINKKSIWKYPILISAIEESILRCKKVGKFGN